MKIGELARASGVTASRIRFYEKMGILASPPRNQNGYRDYDADLVATLTFVERAKALGFTLSEIARETRNVQATGSCSDTRKLLLDKLASVEHLIAEAQARRLKILDLIGGFHAPIPDAVSVRDVQRG